MSPSHTRKGGRLYRYYVSQTTLKHGAGSCPVGRVPAAEIEAAVVNQVRQLVRSPEIVARTWKELRGKLDGMTEPAVRCALQEFDALWDELFPTEQSRIVQLLVERIDLTTSGANIRMRDNGLETLTRELLGKPHGGQEAA